MKHHSEGIAVALGLAAPLALERGSASAEDTLKIAIGQINNWENQPPTLGQDAGIFKKHDLKLENVGTQGAGETIQAVISGSADIGAGVGVAGVMRAFSKGAPVRILAPAFTGTGDLYWYVKADSKIKSLKDATPRTPSPIRPTARARTTSSSPSSASSAPRRSRPRPAGLPRTLTAVMSGQVDIGWAAPPFGLQEIKEGKIRIVAHGSDVPSLRGQTVRVLIVNANALKTKHDAIMRFMQGYREAVDWMYSDPKAVEMYSAKIHKPVELLKESMQKFQPKEALQTDQMADLDGAIKRRGQAQVPGQAADQGAARGIDPDSAGEKVIAAPAQTRTGRCLAQRPVCFAMTRKVLRLLVVFLGALFGRLFLRFFLRLLFLGRRHLGLLGLVRLGHLAGRAGLLRDHLAPSCAA